MKKKSSNTAEDINYLNHFEMFLLTEKRVAKNTFDAYKRDISQFFQFLANEKKKIKVCGKPQLKKLKLF